MREMSLFCLPANPNSARAALRVEQNLKNLEKCSTRLPSPKPCCLRLRANSKKHRFASKNSGVSDLVLRTNPPKTKALSVNFSEFLAHRPEQEKIRATEVQ